MDKVDDPLDVADTDSGALEGPRWRFIAQTLKQEILSGHFEIDRPLPSDTKVAERFAVSRMTARKALASLQSKGIIRIEHGRGSFVEIDAIKYRLSGRHTFSKNVIDNGMRPSRRLLAADIVQPDDWVRQSLGLPLGSSALRIRLVSEADNRPLALSTCYLELPRFDGFVSALGPEANVENALQHFALVEKAQIDVNLLARMPSEEEATLLDQSLARPVMEKRASSIDQHGQPVWCYQVIYAADRVQFRFDRL
ncbi:GntR family transcriptional regulator [Bradyrhizobium sp. CCBAU 21360]|uniref:GntR family transcriptional regulator n=1 Tax=Bradyrhizobium sp. CCBAU 21360 TaxID=1325081 RepID=UPI002306B60E|nr:GntR family transcriptional regulator [Bradyrhizobium sp. CCBAU 21360]